MTPRKIAVTVLIILVAISGFVAGLFLLRERQEFREEAAVPGGQAKVTLKPETGNYNVGDSINLEVYFNPANIPISGVAVQLKYPFSGASPEVSVSSIQVNQTLLSSGDWTCPSQESTQSGANVLINIGCANTSSAGFVSNSDTLLANVSLQINRAPSVSPFVVSFDPAESIITRKADNQDILLIPVSTGTYSIAGAGTSASPTPTTQVTLSPSPTSTLTATPTKVPTATATAQPKGGADEEQLPDAGVSYPTMFGFGLGVIVLIGAILLAI